MSWIISIQNNNNSAREFWKTLYDGGALIDCVIYTRCADSSGQSFRAFRCHQVLLAAHSNFFRQCFLLHQSDSSKPVVVFLTDIEPHIFESILSLIYTGIVATNNQERDSLIQAINKLEVLDFLITPRGDAGDPGSKTKRFKSSNDSGDSITSNDVHAHEELVNEQHEETDKTSPKTMANPSEMEPIYACPVCDKQYSYKISLNKHIKSIHPNA